MYDKNERAKIVSKFNQYISGYHKYRPNTCKLCGSEWVRIHGHHYDYNKPYEVLWVCQPCHIAIHKYELDSISDLIVIRNLLINESIGFKERYYAINPPQTHAKYDEKKEELIQELKDNCEKIRLNLAKPSYFS